MSEDAPTTDAAAVPAPKDKGVRIHVKNLGEDMTTEALLALFTGCGTVQGGEVKTNDEGKCKGFGFVVMATDEEAAKAIAEVNGKKQGDKEIMVVLASAKKEKAEGKGDKGAGKGKKEKGKGKGKTIRATSTNDAAAAMYPYAPSPYAMPMAPYGAMADPYGMGMDQMTMQMMMTQQLYMMQMQAAQMQMAAPAAQAASNDKGAGKKGKGKGKAKDKGKKVEGTFQGQLKSINTKEDRGFGFIECAETMATYGRDVFVSSDLVPKNAKVGDKFSFNVILNDKGQLRASNVTAVS